MDFMRSTKRYDRMLPDIRQLADTIATSQSSTSNIVSRMEGDNQLDSFEIVAVYR